eukprot:2533277-Amphidinium_carterae.1
MKTVCYMYFEELRLLRHQWRKEQIEVDIKKNDINIQKAKKREEERQQTEKQKTANTTSWRNSTDEEYSRQ